MDEASGKRKGGRPGREGKGREGKQGGRTSQFET